MRQSSGCNTHPTSQQFVITVSFLSFYGLVRSVSNGNAEPGILTALLEPDMTEGSKTGMIESILNDHDIPSTHQEQIPVLDHTSCVSARSDDRLIFYICSYVARKFLPKLECDEYHKLLLTQKEDVGRLDAAQYTRLRDNGGLLYPTGWLFRFIRRLENLFITTFSTQELHHERVMDVLALIKRNQQDRVGCGSRAQSLTAQDVAFYVTTRLHFFVKSLNRSKNKSRDTSRYLKWSRCT